MSSEFYSPSLSRNLVRTGGAGYRENASLRLLLNAAEETAIRQDRDAYFAAFPDFGVQTDVSKRSVPAGRIRLSKPTLSFGKQSLPGPSLS
ncbi:MULTISPECIES: hypothetical protein [Rhizobium/Agrobacterium group]|uniref:Uncharacterized protein n=1 Tax=Rhizobium rhizogenes TaxID=359 RepID=A0A546X9J3_RHIRH|nr:MULTISPECIES: hypothetical protein [Rhizobium/Agrobacterium group]TRA97418.1 hypothetical protein EXN68_23645 [Rhizobium rhizogenes]